jgi:hypothetical protein
MANNVDPQKAFDGAFVLDLNVFCQFVNNRFAVLLVANNFNVVETATSFPRTYC